MRNRNLNRFLTIGSIATGVAAISAAPAGAVAITNGTLNFSSSLGTTDFYQNVESNSNFSVTFNPPPSFVDATATNGVGANTFDNYFNLPANQKYSINSTSADFTYNGVINGQNTYRLSSGDLTFTFGGTDTSISINNNSLFGVNFNNGAFGNSFTLASIGALGSITNTSGTTDTVSGQQVAFAFTDLFAPGGGTFSGQITATAVPEPFTIIGTMLGGAAALRLRKRLKAENKL